MMMDRHMTKDCVDDVRVGHVQQVGHGVWQCGVRSETEMNPAFIDSEKKVSDTTDVKLARTASM